MITSNTNNYVKLICGLHNKKGRGEHNLYLAEGIHLIQEAIRSGAILRNFFWTSKIMASEEGVVLLKQLQENGEGFEVSEPVMAKMAETESPQGVIATVVFPEHPPFNWAASRLGLILDGLQDPGNVGTIIRTAWAAGLDGIFLMPGTADPYQGKVVRASQGGVFHVPLYLNCEPKSLYDDARKHGVQIVAGDVKAETSYFESNLCAPTLFLVGNEGRGLTSGWENMEFKRVYIPQPGHAESLNVSISAALLIYEAIRQKMGTKPRS